MLLCPFDATELKVVNRSGIEIDWCPACKGVWLERGELDKLIDQVSGGPTPPAPASPEPGYIPPTPQAPVPAAPPAAAPGPGYAQPHPGPAPMAGYGHPGDYRPPRNRDWSSDSWDDDRSRGGRRRKRKSLLSEIFDF